MIAEQFIAQERAFVVFPVVLGDDVHELVGMMKMQR